MAKFQGYIDKINIKKNLRFRGKNEKGKRKTEENYFKNVEKGLKNASFRVIRRFVLPAANLFVESANVLSIPNV